jgi:hypothetical protein
MFARLDQAGAQHSQSPGRCRYKAGDGAIMSRRDTDALVNIAQFINTSQKTNEWASQMA